MALNVTTAVFGENCNTATASPSLAQWDKGQVLQISGVDLPDAYQVEFSTVYTRNAIPVIGNASGVQVPNELLQRSAPITACVVLHSTANSRDTEYWVTIHITPRKPPETITPDPEQQDVIDQAIAALQDGTARAEAAANSAEGSANDAEAAAEAVQNLSVAAETLATGEPATVEKTVDEETGAVTLTFGLPRGVKGDPLTYEDLTPEQKAELVQGPILEAQNSAVTAVGNARASAVDAVGSAGTTAVGAVNQAGTTQTAAVNQAGITQVQAVTDKGAEVIGSIPPDYSDLADDVADLSRQISDVEENQIPELKSAINTTRVSTSNEFNLICKELYAPTLDFTDATWVRVYNGFSGIYGFRFYNSSNQAVALVSLSSTDWLSNNVANNGAQIALLGDLSLIDGSYKDYRNLTINDVTKVLSDSPTINFTIALRENYRYGKAKFFSASANVINETEITGTTTTGKKIDVYGTERTDADYSIVEFDVSDGKVYKITSLGAGTKYKGITTAEVIANGITVSKYYTPDPDRHTLYISDVTGTVKVCYRNNVIPTITECDRYDFDGAITKTRYELAPEKIPTAGQVLYNADTAAGSGHIVNAIAYKDGVIIAARSNGKVVRIGYDGTETELLTITGYLFDWRLCWMDSNETVFVSPHTTRGTMTMTERGLYRLAKGESSFTKVISLYDPTSSVVTETEENNDTIWTMCEDNAGNLYAGVYAHTTHDNPAIYKSTDGGETWTYLFNFKTAGLTPSGKHIHSVIYSPWQKALYCIVGEVNKIWKSVNGGTTWTDIGVTLPYDKGSSMLALPYGILIGSDGAYNCVLNLLYPDDKTYKTVYVGWANTVFAIRRSDETGFIYAFCKIDSSALYQKYYPPYSVLSLSGAEQEAAIQAWRTSDANPLYSQWLAYHESVKDIFPDDAIIPTHYAILVSRDGGKSFEILKKFNSPASGPDGFWTTGFAANGEILTGHYISTQGYVYPIVISEGKHKYVSGGCDFSGEIFIRTNSSAIANIL